MHKFIFPNEPESSQIKSRNWESRKLKFGKLKSITAFGINYFCFLFSTFCFVIMGAPGARPSEASKAETLKAES